MPEQETRDLIEAIAKRLHQRHSREEIVKDLTGSGMPENDAGDLVDQVSKRLQEAMDQERLTPKALIGGCIGGVVAAIIGGLIWGFLVKLTEYEIGMVAWGIGLLAGLGVVMVSGGKKGPALQTFAVVAAVLGILFGKFLAFMFIMSQVLAEGGGEAISMMQLDWIGGLTVFAQNISELLGGYDLLWIGLAVFTAWKIPAGIGAAAEPITSTA